MQNIQANYLNGTVSIDAPANNQIEISLFGPGYGESILIHIGDGNWILVDSCINPINNKPAALDYLQQIGVNLSESIKLIVATHWHDDHIRGLAEVFQQCTSAEFVISGALCSKEFLTLINAYGKRSIMESSETFGVNEFYHIMEILKDRQKIEPENARLKYAISDRLLWKSSSLSPSSIYNCEVYSLSPSDESKTRSLRNIGKLIPRPGQLKRRILAIPPNDAAVVLWIKIGCNNILLGSDLEKTDEPNTGWSIIVDSKLRPQEKAVFYKIPHHGSRSADLESVWDEMLVSNPVAGLTPFVRGSVNLPKQEDVSRICSKTDYAYSTALPKQKRLRFKDSVVDKTIRETVKNIKMVIPSTGQIRLRNKDINTLADWEVDLFGDAVPLHRIWNY
jgi:hypothetical protein